MNKPKLLTVLISATLILTALNLYATIRLYANLNAIFQKKFAGRMPRVSTGSAVIKGTRNAPVTVIEFSDYQCPYSERFFSQTLPQIEKNYIKTGKVKMAFRNFPLAFHQNAQKAAEAAECSGEQGKYWEYHDTLFKNQRALDVDSLKKYAQDMGLDMPKFNACLDSGKTAPKVKQDLADGQKYGVSGTPCLFINGLKLEGAQPYNVFEEIIETELKK